MTEETPKALTSLQRLCLWIAVVALIIMTAIIGWQVFGRFVLNDTPKWTEQLAGVLMVYLTMFGAAAAILDDGLIALDIFRNRMQDTAQRWLTMVCELLIFLFAAVFVVYGAQMALLVTQWFIPTLGVPRSVLYAAFPIAGGVMLIFSGVRLKRLISSLKG